KGADQTGTDENPLNHGPALPQTIIGWAKNIVPNGGLDEATKTLSFSLTGNTHPEIFAVQPSIDANGNLTFTAKPNASGASAVTFTLSDGLGGSTSQTFNITVTKPHKFHNSADTFASGRNGRDTTGSTTSQPDGFIVAADVLAVINYINANGSGPVNLAK